MPQVQPANHIAYLLRDKFFQFWLILLFLKLVIGTALPLFSDEAYYWVWGQNLQLSYYDHPAGIAWLMNIGSHLGSPFDRWPLIIFSHLALWTWHSILADKLKERELQAYWMLTIFSPLLGLGSILCTPDAPLMVFWALATKLFLKLEKTRSLLQALLLGMVIGLGFCTKYHMVLFPFFTLLWVLWSRQWQLTKPSIILSVLGGVVVASFPVWFWNLQNDWISFRFQLQHGLGGQSYSPSWTFEYLALQLLIITPFLIPLIFKRQKLNYFHFLAFGPLLFFFLTSFKAKVEGNWPIVAYPAIYLLAVTNLRPLLIRLHNLFWGFLGVLTILSIWLVLPGLSLSKTKEPRYFGVLYNLPEKYDPLYGSTYQISSMLWHAQKKPIYKLRYMNRRDFFDYLPGSQPTTDTFYVVSQEVSSLPSWIMKEKYTFEVVEKLTPDFVVYKVSK